MTERVCYHRSIARTTDDVWHCVEGCNLVMPGLVMWQLLEDLGGGFYNEYRATMQRTLFRRFAVAA